MAQNLIGKLRNGFYKTLATASLLGSLNCPMPIEPIQRLSQITQLQNYIDISYRANLENVSQATRKTMYNGNLVETKMISVPSYPETLTNKPKGDYCFILEAPGVTPDTSCVVVPNYQSETPDLNQLNLNLNERDSLVVNLKRPTDKNLEDNPVRYLSATSSDGKTTPSIGNFPNDSVLKIKATGTPGNYQVELAREGSLEKILLQGQIIQLPQAQNQILHWSNRPVPEGGYNEDIYSGDLIKTIAGKDTLVNIKRLTTNPGKDLEPAWSPDGKEILFTSHRTGGTAVWRMNADGSNQRDISSNIVERARQADWCSNGKIVVAYRNNGDSEVGIGIIDPDGTSFTSIYSEPISGQIPAWPKWNFDCSEIAFEKFINSNYEIFTVNANGSNLRNITNNPAGDLFPFFSSNQSEMLFRSDRAGTPDIYIMNIDGSNVRRITSDLGVET